MTRGGIDYGRVRLVATDLDGTLLRSDGTVSPRAAEALARLEPTGIDLVFVTARPPRWLGRIADATGHHGIAICANGAATYDLRTECILDSYPVAQETALEVVRRLRSVVPGGTFAVETIDGFACEPGHQRHQWDEDLRPRLADAERLLESPALKLLFGHPAWSANDLLGTAQDSVGALVEPTYSNPERSAIELSARGVSKATTLARFCEARSIAASEVLAFGDMPNDLPMLAWAGAAVAVANAHRQVLSAVAYVTASNDDDGVAQVLEQMLGSQG